MTIHLINKKGFLLQTFADMKTCKKYIKEHGIKNYLILKLQD